MTQFNLADELRRGGTGLLAQAVADLRHAVRELNPGLLPDEYWLHNLQARAAAVPAGNQAKAPTALDEMRALQEGAPGEASQCSAPMNDRIREAVKVWEKLSPAETVTAWYEVDAMTHGEAVAHFRLKLEKVSEELRFETDLHHKAVAHSFRMSADNCRLTDELRAQLTESREALARVEAERDAQDSYIATLEKQLTEARRGLSALDQAASGPECAQKGHAYATNKGECCIYCFRPKAECLHMGEPASEAEVTERAIVVGSTWEHIGPERWGAVAVESLGGKKVCYRSERVSGCRDEAFFRASFTWVSDPEATESAPREG